MLTDDKTITTPGYWDSLYTGKRNNAKVDSSNGVRTSTFDRFTIVADLVEGPNVLEVAAGHARIASMIKARCPKWEVRACDQSTEAMKVSGFNPYLIFECLRFAFKDKLIDTLICCQALEYFEDLDKALTEFKRVAHKAVFTFPNGEMGQWSQLYVFTPESVKELLSKYGKLSHFEVFDHLILVKIVFE